MSRKFVDRNRPAVALGTALVLALAGGLIATGWQFREALNERTNAEQVSRVLQDVILSPSQWSKVSHDNSLVLTADATVTELWTALEAYVATQELTPETKAQIYVALADGNLNLDRWEEADRLSQTAIDVHAQTMSARAEWQRALLVQTAARHKGNHPEAGRSYETLLSVMDEGPERGTAEHGFVLKNYGVWLWSQGDLAQAASHLERARDIIELTGRELALAHDLRLKLLADLRRVGPRGHVVGRVEERARRVGQARRDRVVVLEDVPQELGPARRVDLDAAEPGAR